jgi:hypothetical protein
MTSPGAKRVECPSPPCWWRERYTYALAAVVGVHLVLGSALVKLADASSHGDFVMGFLLGQGYLLGLWAALGGLRAVARFAIVGTLCTAGVVSFVTAISQEGYWESVLFGGLLGMLFVTGVAICLLPLRGLAGWRVDFDPAYYAHLPLRRGQIGLLDYAGYTCAVAGPLVIVRLLLELSGEETAGMGSIIAMLALIGATAAVPSYIVLRWRRFWLGALASAAWIVVATLVHSQLSRYFGGLSMGTGGWRGIIDFRIGAFHAGVGIAVVTTLGYLRRWGLKLLVVPEPSHLQ